MDLEDVVVTGHISKQTLNVSNNDQSVTGSYKEAQLMLTTGSTRLAVSRGPQTWYHFWSIATFR